MGVSDAATDIRQLQKPLEREHHYLYLKRLLGLIDNQDIVPNERPGSHQETHHKRSIHLSSNNIFRDDELEKAYMSDDRRNSSWRRSVAKEAYGSRHELVPYETRTSSKPLKPLQDFPMYCHYNDFAEYNRQQQEEEEQSQKVNSINKRSSAASTGIAGTRHRNSERRADDGRGPGAFSNSMQIYHVAPHITRKSPEKRGHHHHRRSLDLGEVNRQCLSDSDAHVQSNAQARSYLQFREISRDAQKLGNILNAAKDGRDARRDLLKGAMDLEESLRILSNLQKATGILKPVERPRQSVDLKELLPHSHRVLRKEPPRHSFDGRREPARHSLDGRREPPRLSFDGRELGPSTTFDLREAIRSSLDRQKMLYSKNGDGGTEKNHIRPPESIPGTNAGMQLVENKKRIPNVIARLMGLDEMPSDSHSKTHANSSSVPSRVVARTNSPIRRRTFEEEDAAALRGLKPERPRPQQSMPRPSFVQSRKPVQDSGGGQQAGVHMKSGDYHDTIQAALKQIKQQPPTKPSFHEELSQKLKRLHSVDTQNSDQEPKTLKQILETMQIKGILHSNSDQVKQKVDDVHMHEPVKILKPVTDMPKLAVKAQEHREPVKILKPVTTMAKPAVKEQEHSEQPFQAGNPLPEKVLSMVRNPKPSNKIVAKEASSQSSIVLIKPVTQAQTAAKANDLHPKSTASSRNKQGNLGKKTELEKKKLTNSELSRSEGNCKSKKKKNANGSQASVKRLKQKTRCSNDGVQKHSKSQQSPPPQPPPPQSPPVLQDLRRRRSERISKTKNNNKVSSPPTSKTEKQRSAQDRNTHSKPKGSASRPRSSLSPQATDQISSDVWQNDKQNAQTSIEIPEPAINQNGQRIDLEDNNDDRKSGLGPNIEWTPECPNVESLHPPSEESSDGESSSATPQHNNNTQELIAISEISVVSVLELQQEADRLDEEDETADSDDENEEDEEEEDQEEDLSSLPTHLQDSDEKADRFPAVPDDKTQRFGVSNDNLLNYANEEESTAPAFDDCETDYRDNLWQLLAKDRTLIDSEAAEPTEPYSRLYHKLQEIEAASYSSHDGGKQEHAIDDLEQRLVLDCVKELLKRKARVRLQMKQPFALSRRRRGSLGLSRRNSIQELVQELSSDVEVLRAYQQAGPCDDVRNDKLGSDFVYTVLKKDLDMGNGCVNSIWNPSWDNGLYGEEEAQEIGRDIENLVFDELVEETILDYVLV